MWKDYRLWFGQGFSKPVNIIRREDPPYSSHKELKPTRMILRARNEEEALRKVRKFFREAEITGVYGIKEETWNQ